MTDDSKPPEFKPVDLTELMTNGVLFAANEQFFWPLGLALTWSYDPSTGKTSDLHIRQWEYEDGHHETIELEANDSIGPARRAKVIQWLEMRLPTIPAEERAGAEAILQEVRNAQ